MNIIKLAAAGLEFSGSLALAMFEVRYPRPFRGWRERMKMMKKAKKQLKAPGPVQPPAPAAETTPRPKSRASFRATVKPPWPEIPEELGAPAEKSTAGVSGTIPGAESPSVSPELAGKIAEKLFSMIHAAEPAWDPLKEEEKLALQDDLSGFIQSVGILEKMAVQFPRVSFFITLFLIVSPRLAAVKKARKKAAEEAKIEGSRDAADHDRRKGEDGEDDAGAAAGPAVQGA